MKFARYHGKTAYLTNASRGPVVDETVLVQVLMATLAVENCLAVLEGKTPPTPVNPEALAAARKWSPRWPAQ